MLDVYSQIHCENKTLTRSRINKITSVAVPHMWRIALCWQNITTEKRTKKKLKFYYETPATERKYCQKQQFQQQ